MIKVGRPDNYVDKGKTARNYTYKDVVFDKHGWADAKQYLPLDFDLVTVKIKDKKDCSAWVCGRTWEGLHVNEKDIIIAWKRRKEICH